MTQLERKLQARLRRLGVGAQSSVVVGVSGGADSMALLDALIRLRQRTGAPGVINAAHLNHLLRGAAADADMQFVQTWAEQRGVSFFGTCSNVAQLAKDGQRNLEATARTVRYDFFRQVARQCDAQFICTAHTFDDQVETLLMRLLRGTGAAGLRGIHEVSELGEGLRLLRPLLNVTRAEVLEHCAQLGVEFRTDETNASEKLTRNRVRHSLLPLLRSFNPRVGEALVRVAAALEEDDDFLRQSAAQLLKQVEAGTRLRLAPLNTAHPALSKRVLRAWLQGEGKALRRLDAVHLQTLLKLITQGQSGKEVELPGGWRVVREFAELRLVAPAALAPVELPEVTWNTTEPVEFGGYRFTLQRHLPRSVAASFLQNYPRGQAVQVREGKELDALRLRTRRVGDAYVPERKQQPVKLKMLLTRHKIGKTERAAHPLLTMVAGQIVWSPGLPVANEFALPAEADICALLTVEKH
ncbi:MAG: tRNA lysidine(34) synthetase TilS [Acidobacteria bacterium]|nr:tRNA lysidine(34) synthetase TilS [Acidobacteriota bacterium]MBI3424921.1 tRNA lysidine(34) synthetase TilS [Acidobacteriota bacterium]